MQINDNQQLYPLILIYKQIIGNTYNNFSEGIVYGNRFPPCDGGISRNYYFQKRCVMFSKLSNSSVCSTRHNT